MCFCCCPLWTSKIFLYVLCFIVIPVSFLLGPLNTLFLATGFRSELITYFETEVYYAVFICFILGLLWLTFISHMLLLVGTCYRKVQLLNLYIWLLILSMVCSLVLSLKYAVYCAIVDRQCFDHSEGRDGDDASGALGVLLLSVIYVAAGFVIIFLVCNFKIGLRR